MKTCTNARAIRQILCTIEHVVNCMDIPGFCVHVEITTENGVIYDVPFTACVEHDIKITDYCLTTPEGTISLNYISKIVIVNGGASHEKFMRKLACEIHKIMKGVGCSSDAGDCVACIQKFINCNKLDIECVNYHGGMQTIVPVAAVSDIKDESVLTDVTPIAPKEKVVNEVTLNTTDTPVAGPLTVRDTEVVTGCERVTKDLATGVKFKTMQVSPPISTEIVNVVTELTTTADVTEVVTSVTSTDTEVNSVTEVTTNKAATAFNEFQNVNNVLHGITSATKTATTPFTNTPISVAGDSTKIGKLQIFIPKNFFANNVPSQDKTLNVLVEGVASSIVSIATPSTLHALPAQTNLLTGINGEPERCNISVPLTLSTTDFVDNVDFSPIGVAGPVDTTKKTGRIIETLHQQNINNPTVGTALDAVYNVEATTERLDTLGTFEKKNIRDLVSSTDKTVLSDAGILKDKINVVTDVTMDKERENVVKSLDTSSISVMAPCDESIEGNVVCAGNGIMTVENDNGDISLYNICDINSVNTEVK